MFHLLRQGQSPHEVTQIVGQGVKLEPHLVIAELADDSRVHLMAYLPSLMYCSAVPR